MDEISRRLEIIEQRLALLEQRVPASFSKSAEVVSRGATPPPPIWREEGSMWGGLVAPDPAGTSPVQASPSTAHIESYIGRWFLGVIGVVAVLFGVSFFL